jgi:hypothetical protein
MDWMSMGAEVHSWSNAMIDISPASFLPPLGSDATHSRLTSASLDGTSLGELFALCMAQISKTPALRDVARHQLSQHLKGLVDIPNPDIYFINTRSMDGSISRSLSLTDGLLQALIQGVSSLANEHTGIYAHHDSVHEAHRVPNLTVAETWQVFEDLILTLPSTYKDRLDEFWSKNPQKFLGLPGFLHGMTDTHHGIVSDLQAMALNHEAELKLAEGIFSPEEESRISDVVHDLSTWGIYTVSLVATGRLSVLLTSTFVITQAEQVANPLVARNSNGTVFLVSPSRGLEKFDSLASLDEVLIQRLADGEERELLLQDMLLRDRARLLENDPTLSGVRAGYSFLRERLLNYRTLSLRHKQIQDFEFTLKYAQENEESVSVFLQKVSDVQYLKSFDRALQHHFLSFSSNEQQKVMPSWLRLAPSQEKASYLALQEQCLKDEQAVSRTLAGLESLETFALHEIEHYVREHLGYSVDPDKVLITFSGQSLLREGDIHTPLGKSLLAFAVEGFPASGNLGVATLEVPDESRHRAWTFEFVETMLAELDVRYGYMQALRARYADPKTHRAMVRLRDSSLALAALAASLQSETSGYADVELITRLREGKTQEGTSLMLGHVTFGSMGGAFKDWVAFHEKAESAERYVLYAPGAPGGRDLFSFHNWNALSTEVGGWLKTSAGLNYLVDQTAGEHQEDARSFFSFIQEKPNEWRTLTIRFSPVVAPDYETALSTMVAERAKRHLADMAFVTPFDFRANSYEDRRELAAFDARLATVEAAYVKAVDLKSYREYAREEGKRLLTDYLRKQGIYQTIDPETVYVDLHNSAHRSVADFSEYTHLRPLTDFFMQGQTSRYAFHEKAVLHSSVGQDVSIVPLHAITEALKHEVGENYIALLGRKLWTPHDNDNLRRRQLYAQSLELQMRRAVQIEWMQGRLNTEQHHWLNQLILSVSTSRSGNEEVRGSSMHVLTFKRLPVEGVLRFKHFEKSLPEYDLIYTPQAPDGILFRETRSIAQSMQSPGMPEYYYGRVRYQDQANVVAMIDAIDHTSDIRDPLSIDNGLSGGTAIGPNHRITNLQALYIEMIERMMIDVDNQNVSGGEVLADRIYTAVKWTGTVLLIPFAPAALAWSYLHTMIAFARGVVAYATGDRATANNFFAWGMFGLWFGLLSVPGGLKNEPSLVWSILLKVTSKTQKISGKIKLYPRYIREVRRIYQ